MILEKSKNKYPEKPRLKKGKLQKACFSGYSYPCPSHYVLPKCMVLHLVDWVPILSLNLEKWDVYLTEITLTNAIVKSEVVKDILQKNYFPKKKYRRRVDFGGSRENSKWNVNIPFDNFNSLLDEIKITWDYEQNQLNMKELDTLVNFLYNESPSPEVKLQGELSGTQINAINFA